MKFTFQESKSIENQYLECGSTRIRSRFLLFPKRIGLVLRWFERATWVERYDSLYIEPAYKAGTVYGRRFTSPRWRAECWGTTPLFPSWIEYFQATKDSAGCEHRRIVELKAESRINRGVPPMGGSSVRPPRK